MNKERKNSNISLTEASMEAAKLREKINYHNVLYYQKDTQEITDSEYDTLRKRLESLEQDFPSLVIPRSPTQKVGAKPSREFTKVKHALPMLSLSNSFNDSDVVNFVNKVWKFLLLQDTKKLEFLVEPKIDGLSCSLRYEKHILVQAVTRGDGEEGEDITGCNLGERDCVRAVKPI